MWHKVVKYALKPETYRYIQKYALGNKFCILIMKQILCLLNIYSMTNQEKYVIVYKSKPYLPPYSPMGYEYKSLKVSQKCKDVCKI